MFSRIALTIIALWTGVGLVGCGSKGKPVEVQTIEQAVGLDRNLEGLEDALVEAQEAFDEEEASEVFECVGDAFFKAQLVLETSEGDAEIESVATEIIDTFGPIERSRRMTRGLRKQVDTFLARVQTIQQGRI